MKHTVTTIIIIACIIFMISCKKSKSPEPDLDAPTVAADGSVQAMLKKLASPVQTFTVNLDTFTRHMCINGTTLMIQKSCLLSPEGETVHGPVTIEVKEIYSKKDLILNNMFPASNTLLLAYNGSLYIRATQNGKVLKKDPAGILTYFLPTDAQSPLQRHDFYASGPSDLSERDVNWFPSAASVTLLKTQLNGSPCYFFRTDSMGWFALGEYDASPQERTTCTVKLSGDFNGFNTLVFLSKNGSPAVAKCFSPYNKESQQFRSYQNAIPEGEDYTAVAIGFDGIHYYYSSQQVTMSPNMVIDLPTLVQATRAQIESNLSSLP